MYVASLAEAWIETPLKFYIQNMASVASLAEAWIETDFIVLYEAYTRSPPSRRRGLKLAVSRILHRSKRVASLAEAWIETV